MTNPENPEISAAIQTLIATHSARVKNESNPEIDRNFRIAGDFLRSMNIDPRPMLFKNYFTIFPPQRLKIERPDDLVPDCQNPNKRARTAGQ